MKGSAALDDGLDLRRPVRRLLLPLFAASLASARSAVMRRLIVSAAGVGVLAIWLPVPNVRAAASCDSLSTLALRGGTVTLAQMVAAGAFVPPAGGRGRGGAPAPYGDLPAFCRVAATLRPTSDSAINIEVWMPAAAAEGAGGWNGKLEAIGGQGWAGSIGYAGLRDALRRGYAATATDSGHSGGAGTFALEHAEQLVDFAYRSAHEMTLAAKAIVTGFYSNGPRFSYWDGCSTGGRTALTEAQRFPDDFDGIIAGAPANFSSHQAAQMMSVALAVHRDEASYIPPSKYSLIHQAVIEACDARDGVKDGVLEDPTRCVFDPNVLACRGEPRAEKAYDGMMDAINPDLTAFFGRGGKLLQYHGWSDQAVAPANSVNYYNSVMAKSGGAASVQRSYRLFMVPGMTHCLGGEGTSTFDALAALERWVEKGEAPVQIPASRVAGGVVNRTRPLCPYPQVATYKGTGSIDEATNFECKTR
jgi:hypothetical protein